MNRIPWQIVLLTLVALGLGACGRKEASPAVPVPATQDKPKTDAKRANPPDDAPKVADPLKEGY